MRPPRFLLRAVRGLRTFPALGGNVPATLAAPPLELAAVGASSRRSLPVLSPFSPEPVFVSSKYAGRGLPRGACSSGSPGRAKFPGCSGALALTRA